MFFTWTFKNFRYKISNFLRCKNSVRDFCELKLKDQWNASSSHDHFIPRQAETKRQRIWNEENAPNSNSGWILSADSSRPFSRCQFFLTWLYLMTPFFILSIIVRDHVLGHCFCGSGSGRVVYFSKFCRFRAWTVQAWIFKHFGYFWLKHWLKFWLTFG